MQSNEKKHFNIMLNEEDILTYDTNITKNDTLLKVIATTNAATINLLTEATGRDDVALILVHETLVALSKIREDEGGETDESN